MASSTTAVTGVGRCLAVIRNMIISGELLPGQKLHQAELAAQLKMSRIPVREALSTLQAEGVLDYKPNVGFTVARFSSDDLTEIYLMRRVLESEILRTIDLSRVDVEELERINAGLTALPSADTYEEFQDINRRFHFRLFEYSPLALVCQEVSRLWYMSSFYRSLYMHETDSNLRICADHERILQAVRDRDVEELIRASDDHRRATEALVVRRLGRSRPR